VEVKNNKVSAYWMKYQTGGGVTRVGTKSYSRTPRLLAHHTDYRCECVSKKVRVGAGQYLLRILGFTAEKNVLEYQLPLVSKTIYLT
jgi:hypothetical protein